MKHITAQLLTKHSGVPKNVLCNYHTIPSLPIKNTNVDPSNLAHQGSPPHAEARQPAPLHKPMRPSAADTQPTKISVAVGTGMDDHKVGPEDK